MRVFKLTPEFCDHTPVASAANDGAQFDRDDLVVIHRELLAARERVQPHERHALDRLIDQLDKAAGL